MAAYKSTIKFRWSISKEALLNCSSKLLWLPNNFKCDIPNLMYTGVFGESKTMPHKISFFVILKNIKVDSTFAIESVSLKVSKGQMCKNKWGIGTTLMKQNIFDDNKKYFINNVLTIDFEANLTYTRIFSSSDFKDPIFNHLWEDPDKNFAFIVKDKEIKVHKAILKANSDVFQAMLASNMKEAQENQCPIVEFSYECVALAVRLLYKHDCLGEINEHIGSELLHFADKYHIESLQDLIEKTLVTLLTTSNVVMLANATTTSNAMLLQEQCICFLIAALKESAILKNVDLLENEIAMQIIERSSYYSFDFIKNNDQEGKPFRVHIYRNKTLKI